MEYLLGQPSEKRDIVKKEVFIKGKQDILDDVLTFIANVVVFARFQVQMYTTNCKAYPFVIQLLIEVTDVLSPADYSEFD